MRKVFSFISVSVDGYHEGAKGELDWHNVDEEFNAFAIEQLDAADTLVFGRATYEVMASYWPTKEAREGDPEVAARMNDSAKVVVSRTLGASEWARTRVVRDVSAIAELKLEAGREIAVLGSSALTASLLRHGILDELRLMVMPVALGEGRSLFGGADRVALELLDTRRFASGNTLLTYRPR
ncbi:dihydrofolate reductase family protein [Actinomadura sp. 6N118]|uniref:dihydrofolate reductase family protein n=1 Tax=Actinomadura sp. 6N118 TaxID=3375151 RepID=UPI0037B12792